MIDFSNAKRIVIPDGEVAVIAKGDEIMWEKHTKPSIEYQKVEYIESTGRQFIDIGYPFNSNTDAIELDYACLETSQYKWIFGNYVGKYLGLSTHTYQTLWYGGSSVNFKFTEFNTERHKIVIDENGVSFLFCLVCSKTVHGVVEISVSLVLPFSKEVVNSVLKPFGQIGYSRACTFEKPKVIKQRKYLGGTFNIRLKLLVVY